MGRIIIITKRKKKNKRKNKSKQFTQANLCYLSANIPLSMVQVVMQLDDSRN